MYYITQYVDVLIICCLYIYIYHLRVTELYDKAECVFCYWYFLTKAKDNSRNMLEYYVFLICSIFWL